MGRKRIDKVVISDGEKAVELEADSGDFADNGEVSEVESETVEDADESQLPGLELGMVSWVLKGIDGGNSTSGIEANICDLNRRFNKLSREAAEKGEFRKKARELEDMSLAIRVLKEVKAAML